MLKNRDVYGAKKILMNFYFNPNSEAPLIMEEMNEISEFMANFVDPDIDVIWGTAYDYKLEDQIKVTILAAGFNVSLDREAPVSNFTIKREPTATAMPTMSDDEKLKAAYGDKAVNDMTRKKLSTLYIVLRPDQMDDDDIIDMLENTPTYKRKPDFRNQIKERQQAVEDRPVEVPKPASKRNGGDSQTIDFGEN